MKVFLLGSWQVILLNSHDRKRSSCFSFGRWILQLAWRVQLKHAPNYPFCTKPGQPIFKIDAIIAISITLAHLPTAVAHC